MERHNMMIRILKQAHEKKQISDGMYEHFMMEIPEADSWEQAFDQLLTMFNEIIEAIANHEYYILLERLEKGEQMIESETDPRKKKEYMTLFKDLLSKFQAFEKRGETA